MLVAVELVPDVDGVVEGAAGLDGLVRAGLDAEPAVHAEAEVDLVAVDVEGAVFAGDVWTRMQPSGQAWAQVEQPVQRSSNQRRFVRASTGIGRISSGYWVVKGRRKR